ncbi:MAG: PrsW family intramembrane metalloprotease [Candidatus Liptonbacteria bacterium]|nr:PrsW family intramembrane metalloprotease [Candidatus Liptonbacteria bacterium]
MVDLFSIILVPLLSILLGGIWLIFFLFEDRKRPEPPLMIAKTFVLGFFAVFVAAGLQGPLNQVLIKMDIAQHSFLPLTVFSLIEEVVKFMVVFIFIRKSGFLDEPIDYMIYMITAGLGFATLENFLHLASLENYYEIIELASLRFVGATLMHALSSGLLGYFWAKKKILLGIFAATLLHLAFNKFILMYGPFLIPIILLIIAAVLLFNLFDKIKYVYKTKYKK